MHIHHIRNATTMLSIGPHHILIDPMMCAPGTMPPFKLFGTGRQRNPLNALPSNAGTTFDRATAVLITHEHPDHLDQAAITWITERKLPVFASSIDAPNLRKKLPSVTIVDQQILDIPTEVIPAKHGSGLLGWLMGPVSGYYLDAPDEPSIYITADSIWTPTIQSTIERLQPDIILAPAGAASFGLGRTVIFSEDELVQLTKLAPHKVVFNHMESLDHCPITREHLFARMTREGLDSKVLLPQDGESLTITQNPNTTHQPPRHHATPKPGAQKWFTSPLTGT